MPYRDRTPIHVFLAVHPSFGLLLAFLTWAMLDNTWAVAADRQATHGPAAIAAESRPASTGPSRQPLWTFAWLSDMHIGTARPEFIAKALKSIDALKPHFLLITGDNNFLEAAPANPDRPESLGLRRQRFLKVFLHEHLKTPYVLIPGNNWPEEFDKVFGPKQYSFDCGGLHFTILDADRAYRGPKGANIEGFTAFNKSTWDWTRQDLQRSRRQPVVVALHEPIYPITFLDARPLRELLDRYPNVFLVLQGHLHVDLEFHRNGKTYLVAPALGKTSAPAMKLVNVYPEGLSVRTIRFNKTSDRFEIADREQEVAIPESLRRQLVKPSGEGFVRASYDSVPAHPFVEDSTLANRSLFSELLRNADDAILSPK